mmetsp:Transcript_8399/g.25995  ORF Transcript_8399/g.25995 Transcript_8399/m.25995 type:complete len:214 (+) Transcript_8399:1540-2181(+)
MCLYLCLCLCLCVCVCVCGALIVELGEEVLEREVLGFVRLVVRVEGDHREHKVGHVLSLCTAACALQRLDALADHGGQQVLPYGITRSLGLVGDRDHTIVDAVRGPLCSQALHPAAARLDQLDLVLAVTHICQDHPVHRIVVFVVHSTQRFAATLAIHDLHAGVRATTGGTRATARLTLTGHLLRRMVLGAHASHRLRDLASIQVFHTLRLHL